MNVLIKNKQKGFSLIEVIIAIFILGVGIVSITGLMAKNIRYSLDSRNLTIISELAQEGIELVRNIRDNNFAAGETAFQSDFPVSSTTDRIVDKNSTTVTATGSARLYYDANGFYVHNGTSGNESQFYRKIDIAYSGSPISQATISSVVWWGGSAMPNPCSAANRCITVVDILTDWHE